MSELPPPSEDVELGPDVPPALRQTVAAALAWLDRLDEEAEGPTPPR